MSLSARELRSGRPDAKAAEWVARCDAGLSDAERRDFERWRDAAPENLESFNRLSATWTDLARPLRTGESESLLAELSALRRRDRSRRVRLASATLTLGVVAAGGWWIQSRPAPSRDMPPNSVVIVPERRVLSDGSTVEYARGAELDIAYSASMRRVILKRGEAHFQVASNPVRPFVVSVNGIDVQAVGTAFTVQAKETAVDVVVTEGRVAVDQERGDSPPRNLALLNQGDGVRVNLSSTESMAPAVTPMLPSALAERLSWRKPKVEFSGVPLTDVVAVLNRHNSAQLVLDDPQIREVLLSGLFRADDTELFLSTLETGFGIAAERRGKQILLRKAK